MSTLNAVPRACSLVFLFILTMVSNPFELIPLAPDDGRGLNPLLLDAGMRIHPPFLLIGYMSFSIPFAFAVAGLVTGNLSSTWLTTIRRWTLLSWSVQGAGLLMGAWWAYHVLGWGGYWGWDPVENVALLPWLTATALLHSLMVQERRGMLKVWNLGLAIAVFALAVFGTFVVRSGVIVSVHSFALSAIGPFFLAFLGLTLILAAARVVSATAQTSDLDRQVREIAAELRCPVCQNLSVADSSTPHALEMRAVIRQKLEAGESREAIMQYFVERYGDEVLLNPPRQVFTLLL